MAERLRRVGRHMDFSERERESLHSRVRNALLEDPRSGFNGMIGSPEGANRGHRQGSQAGPACCSWVLLEKDTLSGLQQ